MHLETLIHHLCHLYLRRIYDSVERDMRCWIFTLFVSGRCSLLMIDPVIVGAMAVSCVQFSVRIRCDLCSTLSLLPLFILTNLHMNVWVWSLLEVLTVCSQWERSKVSKEQRAATCPVRHLLHGKQWACLWQAGGEGCFTGRKFVRKWKPLLKSHLMLRKPVKVYAPFY